MNIQIGKVRKKSKPSCPLVANLRDVSDKTIVKKIIINKKTLNLSKLSFSFDFKINKQQIKDSSGKYKGL